MDQNLSGTEYTFFWSFNDTGTIIGTPGSEIGRRKYAYLFRVAVVNGRATLTISDAPDSREETTVPETRILHDDGTVPVPDHAMCTTCGQEYGNARLVGHTDSAHEPAWAWEEPA